MSDEHNLDNLRDPVTGELMSTAERYLPGPHARIVKYWDYDPDAHLTCPRCGWDGTGGGYQEVHSELMDVSCPECEQMILIVSFPTNEETKAAAAAGNVDAQKELPRIAREEARWTKAEDLMLRDPGQLPELEGDQVVITWDQEEMDGEEITLLLHDGREIWRELAFYEGYERFAQVFQVLLQRYGARFRGLRPTPGSAVWLYGDSSAAARQVEALNAQVAGPGLG